MSEEQRNNLIEKIQKLLAKADGTDSQEEANTFMAKAQELLLKHNLEMSDVQYDDTKIKGAYDAVEFGQIKEEGKWETILMGAICEFNMCHSIIHRKQNIKGGTMSVIGEPHNIQTVLYMYNTAHATFRRLSKQAYNQIRKETLDAWKVYGYTELELQKAKKLPYRMPFIRSYLKGCAVGLYRKMESMQQQVVTAADSHDQFAVMVKNNDLEIESFVKQEFGELKSANRRGLAAKSRHAFEQGKQQGLNYNLAKQVDHDSGPPKQLGHGN